MTDQINLNTLRSVPEFLDCENGVTVVVPKIQRAYAQGRNKELNLRTQFVDELLTAAENDEPLELSFVYGAKSRGADDETYRYELLDGQQRITTLILLYWYVASAENRPVPGFIKSFTYETRTTSTKFLDELSRNTIRIGDGKPSDVIRKMKWYTLSFEKDSSVNGMMNMLDSIHLRYEKSPLRGEIYDRLDNLKFYELDLNEFGLTEEIYVKMNARGLQLTPFENFKADLIKFMKRDDMPEFREEVTLDIVGSPKAPYYVSFSQKLDNRWLNLFWRKEDRTGRDYCARYFRFFYHFFATKCFIDYQKGLKALEFRSKSEGTVWDFFWRMSPLQEKTYFGFRRYEEMLKYRPEYLRTIELILDWLSDATNAALLEEELKEPWAPDNGWNFFGERYRLQDAVMFAAVCEYIERSGNGFDATNFRRWMRIARNAVNDQLFRNVNEIVSLSRNFTRLLDQPGAMENIYEAIATLTDVKDLSRSLRESIKKAKIITTQPDQEWEAAFAEAEKHPFFAGSIGFLLEDLPATPEAFIRRAKTAGTLFDENGMTAESRKNHRLIRMMVRQLDTKEALFAPPTYSATLTERRDSDNHLRALMLEKPEIARLICRLGDMPTVDDAYRYIDSIVDTEPKLGNSEDTLLEEEDVRLKRAFGRVCLEPKLYDFIRDVEADGQRNFVDFMGRNGDYVLHRRRSWYDRIYIGTDRILAIKAALGRGHSFAVEKQAKFFESYDNVFEDFENGVVLAKEVAPGVKLILYFDHNGKISFCHEKESDTLGKLFPESTELTEKYLSFDAIDVEDESRIPDFEKLLGSIEKRIEDFAES